MSDYPATAQPAPAQAPGPADPSHQVAILLTTAPSQDAARTLAQDLISSGNAACVSLIPGIESHYLWEGQKETSAEVQMLIKTSPSALPRTISFLRSRHPYQCPEILHWLAGSSPDYAAWVAAATNPS